MLLLILGLILWVAFHLIRGLRPDWRAALQDRFGDASKGIMAAGIVAGLVLMVVGYRAAPFVPVWEPPAVLRYVNNLLVLLAFYIYLTTATKPGTAFAFANARNPQLAGFSMWAFAHLLVNGDLASIILFGGLLVWAFVEVKLAGRSASLVDRSTAKISSPWVHLGLVIVVYLIVGAIHVTLGVNPFGG